MRLHKKISPRRSKVLFSALFYTWLLSVWAATCISAQVPKQLQFGNLKIRITSHARREIAKKMQALRASDAALSVKVARAHQYFPLITQALREENTPEDFKYLVIQESGLISDAISSSNAVGFWQFKAPAAKEVGLSMNRMMDARLHIIASTKGAARYLKTQNFYFSNWMYALTAYYTGRGGAKKFVQKKYMHQNKMVISKRNHWYIKTFLAHLLVFQEELAYTKPEPAAIRLFPYYHGAGKSLKRIAEQLNINISLLKKYNKWLRIGLVPKDAALPVMLPLQGSAAEKYARKYRRKMEQTPTSLPKNTLTATKNKEKDSSEKSQLIVRNRTPALIAEPYDDLHTLATKGTLSIKSLCWYNDISSSHKVKVGMPYYLKLKYGSALKKRYHTVKKGETLWEIAQKYGLRLRSLRRKNRMKKRETLLTGRILWLKKRRPKNQNVEYKAPPIGKK